MSQCLIAGALAGICSLSVLVPMDLLKVRAQMTKTGKLNYQHEIRAVLSD